MIKITISFLGFILLNIFLSINKYKWGVIFGGVMMIFIIIFCVPLVEVAETLSSWVVLDTISVGLILLRVYLTLLIYLSRTIIFNSDNYVKYYSLIISVLLLRLIICFMVGRYLIFYLFFELRLIPTLLIIIGWGYQPERLQAGVYLFLYTLFASLPLLFILIKINAIIGSLWMWDYLRGQWCLNLSYYFTLLVFLGSVFAFLVKLPMYLTHLWLPKAHLEAPVTGSMILAGVLLKLGGYGLIRILTKLFYFSYFTRGIFLGLRLVGITVVGVMCCRLNDLKALVAYSSVAHIGLVICGIITGTRWGFNGGLIIIIRHGLGSSGLFCIVNVVYERLHRRRIHLNKGVLALIPVFRLIIFLLCCSNISAPPTINLLSEISLLARIFFYDRASMLVFPFGSFLGAVFTFFIFSYSQHGKFFRVGHRMDRRKFSEIHTLILHILPVNFLILKNDFLFCIA